MQTKRFIRIKDVMRATGLARPTIYRDVAAGTFPAPVKLHKQASAWIESEIAAWQAARIAERDAGKRRTTR